MKRGQASAGSVATLIALIALFIILFVLLLPQEERDELLEGEARSSSRAMDRSGGEVLISKFIGEVGAGLEDNSVSHHIPSVNLFTRTGMDTIDVGDNIRVSSSLYSSNSQSLFFDLDNVEGIKDASFFVFVGESKGDLILNLNGRDIYRNDVVQNVQEVIEFSPSLLQSKNVLEVSSSKPGLFGSNIHEVQYIKLRVEKFTTSREALRSFSIPNREFKVLESAVLKYNVFCSRGAEEDVLNILINSKLVFSDVPICNRRGEGLEIGRNDLREGTNFVEFRTNLGDYSVENIEIETFLERDLEFSESFFFLDEDSFTDVRRGRKDIIVDLEFQDDGRRKMMTLEINDEEISVDTSRDDASVEVSNKIEEGDNILRIIPENSFEILSLEVRLV